MPPTSRQADSMVNALLTYVGIDASGASETERATALQWLNEAYRLFLQGVWTDEEGHDQVHVWSFMKETDDLSLTADAAAVDCPADFGGIYEDPTFQYGDGDKGGLDIVRKSPDFVRRRQRDSETTGTPRFWALEHKDFAADTGCEYQLIFSSTPDADLTIHLPYLVQPDDLTDSDAVYPKGNNGAERVIVQIAKAEREAVKGQVEGPEWRKSIRWMRQHVMWDKEVYPTERVILSHAEFDSGID